MEWYLLPDNELGRSGKISIEEKDSRPGSKVRAGSEKNRLILQSRQDARKPR